jgi:hypothetical protein
LQRSSEILGMPINGGIEPERGHQVVTLGCAARKLSQLTDERANWTGCGGDRCKS